VPYTQVRIFGKPETRHGRRMAVALSTADSTRQAREQAERAVSALRVEYGE